MLIVLLPIPAVAIIDASVVETPGGNGGAPNPVDGGPVNVPVVEGIKPNLGIKALLRSSSLKRLIFRDLPDFSSDHSDERIFDRAVFQLV